VLFEAKNVTSSSKTHFPRAWSKGQDEIVLQAYEKFGLDCAKITDAVNAYIAKEAKNKELIIYPRRSHTAVMKRLIDLKCMLKSGKPLKSVETGTTTQLPKKSENKPKSSGKLAEQLEKAEQEQEPEEEAGTELFNPNFK
jgi:hypothetical protein